MKRFTSTTGSRVRAGLCRPSDVAWGDSQPPAGSRIQEISTPKTADRVMYHDREPAEPTGVRSDDAKMDEVESAAVAFQLRG